MVGWAGGFAPRDASSVPSSASAQGPAFGNAAAGVWRTEAVPVALYDEVIGAASHDDLARILELANHGDDRGLRRFDVALPRGPEHLHLFLEGGGRALR